MIPIGNKIVIQPDEIVQKTSGGIIIFDTVKRKEISATVKFVSPNLASVIKPGEKILFPSYEGSILFSDQNLLGIDASLVIIIPE